MLQQPFVLFHFMLYLRVGVSEINPVSVVVCSERSWTRWCRHTHRRSSTVNYQCLMVDATSIAVSRCPSDEKRSCIAWQLLHTNTPPFNGPLSGTTQVSRYQQGKTNLDFTEARDSERQWHQLGHMQVCTLLQTDNHASTPPLSFLLAGCPSCHPTNSVKVLKATGFYNIGRDRIVVSTSCCVAFTRKRNGSELC